MVGYDGSQSSDTYSVAHQVDFLTQKVFHSVKKEQCLLYVSWQETYDDHVKGSELIFLFN